MSSPINKTFSVTLEQELAKSYLDYAMSVIVGRALPDCRDGLKPVHRRILYAMHELGNTPNKPYKKSARILGDVVGKYHPHGENSVYDAIVRMAQPFSMGYTLVDGQGNFGSVDGDMAAAMRYTEIRLTHFAQTLLTDLEKDTVDFSPNYDGNEFIPDVLPAQSPNFLINGSSGIAVGMATQTPPHHLREVMSAFLHYIDNPQCSVYELMEHMPGPDLPTGAQILGTQGIKQAYETGKGRFIIRAVSHNEEIDGRQSIVFTEIPYQINKAKLIEKIAELARDKKLEGIHALRDESDKDGMRIVIELKRDANDSLLMNHLYQQTSLQTSFSINMVGLCNGRPELLTLRKIFESFLQHRLEIVTRRTRFEFDKAKARAHTLEGLSVALCNIQSILDLIQLAPTSKDAKEQLCGKRWPWSPMSAFEAALRESLILPQHLPYGLSDEGYQLSAKQADAILEMRLHKLTSLEQHELRDDFEKLIAEHSEAPHLRVLQKRLAEEITVMVHSQADLENAIAASNAFFSPSMEELKKLDEKTFLEVFDGVPQAEISKGELSEGLDMIAALSAKTNFLASNSDARRELKQNAISLNKEKVAEDYKITSADLINNQFLLLQKGKKNYYVIKVR